MGYITPGMGYPLDPGMERWEILIPTLICNVNPVVPGPFNHFKNR